MVIDLAEHMAHKAQDVEQAAPPEQYAHSLSTIRKMGRVSLDNTVDYPEKHAIQELAFDDFLTAVTEMINTDKEFSRRLDIDRSRTHQVRDGKTLAKDGKPMVNILQKGARASQAAAKENPVLQAQADRDQCDVYLAQRVDTLGPGRTIWGLSMEPKKELREHRKTYLNFGYRDGLSYIQSYSKVDEHTLIAKSYSVDMSDEKLWRETLADYGMQVPEGVSSNEYLLHALEQQATAEEADKLIRTVRADYYKRVGLKQHKFSATEFVQQEIHVLHDYFDVYYEALGVAIETDENSQLLQDFARTLLAADIKDLKPEVRQQLIRMGNSKHFNSEAGKIMDSLIRYAVVEELRTKLPSLINGTYVPQTAGDTQASYQPRARGYMPSPEELHMRATGNITNGVKAGRTYGGCVNIALNAQRDAIANGLDGDQQNSVNPQEAFGGKSSEEDRIGKKRMDNCVVSSCPNHAKKVEVGGCGVCLERCQKLFDRGEDPTTMKAPAEKHEAEIGNAVVRSIFKHQEEKTEPVKAEAPALAAA